MVTKQSAEKKLGFMPDELPPLVGDDGEVRELTDEDFKHFRPAMEVIPHIVEAFERARGQRGAQKSPVKDRVGLRLDHRVVEYFRATGPGWQSRINDILAEHVKQHSK
jgi:uncharacterized protein (DUF4415 family)